MKSKPETTRHEAAKPQVAWGLAALAVLLALGLAVHGPIAQWPDVPRLRRPALKHLFAAAAAWCLMHAALRAARIQLR